MLSVFFFFFNATATTEIYTLSLHDALPICILPRSCRGRIRSRVLCREFVVVGGGLGVPFLAEGDRKSTRLNSSHTVISYAVFCLKKKKTKTYNSFEWTGKKNILVATRGEMM